MLGTPRIPARADPSGGRTATRTYIHGVSRERLRFPFTDTDGGTAPPHVHQRASRRQLAAIERCRLDGTTVDLEGELDAGPAF